MKSPRHGRVHIGRCMLLLPFASTRVADYKLLCWTAKLLSPALPKLVSSCAKQLPDFLDFHSCACSGIILATGSEACYISLPNSDNEVFHPELIMRRKCSCSIFTLAQIKFENIVSFFQALESIGIPLDKKRWITSMWLDNIVIVKKWNITI